MSAGTGVAHSEQNASRTEPVHFLQIWLEPRQRGIAPSYEQKNFSRQEKQGRLRVVASEDAREGSVKVHADATVYAGLFAEGEDARLALAPGRQAWVHVAQGRVRINGTDLDAGDAVAITGESSVQIEGVAQESGEVLIFDLA